MFDVAGRSRLPALGHQALEGQQVELVGTGPDQVPGRLRDEHRVAGAAVATSRSRTTCSAR